MAVCDPQGIAYATANARGMALYDQAVRQMSFFQAPVIDTLDAAIAANPGFGMPWFAKAYLMLYMTEPAYTDMAAGIMQTMRATVDPARFGDVERAHAAAIDAWIGGDLRRAAAILDRLGLDHPREILGLRVGHEMDFFAGASRNLRDRVARQITAWSPDDPHYGIVLGALAFGLEENGQYQAAEETGLHALSLNPQDAWAVHAVAHAFEMRGMTGEGIRFMTGRTDDWAPGNLFAGHNWWHTALFRLDSGDIEGALKTWDEGIYLADQLRVAITMLDASSLLWRLHVDGHDISARARPLSEDWKSVLTDTPYYPFNDMHAAMAHVAAGDQPAADRVVARMERYLAAGDDGTNAWSMTRRVGLPVCRAIAAFGAGQYRACADLLYDVRAHAHEFGGSHAQRDVLDRTLLAAALRGGAGGMARALASERVTLSARNPFNWARFADALSLSGAPDPRVAEARTTADALRRQALKTAAA
ncbi:MAG: tetratricopeptide repeat protein [Pararhodobacter sp.]|nr:tetratricopeptide repeat protein [Pararhodobacter sp.]